MSKPFNSKVIKGFVPELRSRKCFSCFGIPMFYVYMLWNILCMFHIFMYGYDTTTIIIIIINKQHNIQRNNCWKTEFGRQTTVWIFQVTNKRNLQREDLVMAKKEKPLEKNWISSISTTKQRYKNKLRKKQK